MAIGHPVGGKTKTDALNVTRKYYLFRNHFLSDSSPSAGNDRARNPAGDMLTNAPGACNRTIPQTGGNTTNRVSP
jgi:hypothetical protein